MSDKWESRKYQSTWNMTWLVTALLVVPWIVNAIFGLALPILIPPEVWSMLIGGLWGVYSVANVAEKHNSMMTDDVLYPKENSVTTATTSSVSTTTSMTTDIPDGLP